ncbi:MAG: hypothetical protein GY703_02530 [Gammaproteobacteria bacterium]|nr:hypothetical protein [Gammaproteobacteria bacterium]
MDTSRSLSEMMIQQTPESCVRDLQGLQERLIEQYGDSVDALLFYGSCLRNGNARDGLVDLYLVVDDYARAYTGGIAALFNRLLPPNVYYLEVQVDGHPVRAKYAVVSLGDLERGTTGWFHSYLWGRFSQPCGVLYSRNPEIAWRVYDAFSGAVLTFLNRVLPSLPPQPDTREIWQIGMALSYSAELRAEKSQRAIQLYESWEAHYEAITPVAMPMTDFSFTAGQNSTETRFLLDIENRSRRLNRLGWWIRRLQGKLLSVLRLMKAAFTFQGGIDYIAWKLERHTGTSIEITPRMRRHPLLYSWGLVWRLYRRGVFR